MALDPGTRFGPYEITEQIGAGGMGVVYRATDTKLGRDVAIKTLPSALENEPDRLARFEREAQLLAALNHPHIGAIYGLDEHEGMHYLAMELIEGETLEEKLKPGALPLEDALRIALQIAEALEAAHDKGVMHRDLKPANIMVNRDGQVKVLDFGLAKALSGDPNEATAAHSPALSVAMTQAGLILGTAGYMAPEQASGQRTDQRADIWAFGVVLFEMLSGLPLFSGESVPHVLAAVLQNDPDWDRLPKNLHPRLTQLLERCLRKKVRTRYHSIGDVRVDLEEVLSDPEGSTVAVTAAHAAAPTREKLQRIGTMTGMMALAAGVALTGFWFATLPDPVAPDPINRFDYDISEELTFRGTGRPIMALSQDGRHFAFNTNRGLFLRRMGELEARLIPGTEEDLRSPFFSFDGQSVAYFVNGEFKRISISGGAPVIIASGINNPIGASWTEDGTIIAGQTEGIIRVPASGGTPEVIFPVLEQEQLHGAHLLPDGDSVLFSATHTGRWDDADIVIGSLMTGDRTVVLSGGSDARYLPSGHLVYAYEDNLFGIAFDLDTLSVSGGPVPLVQGVARAAANLTGSANYGIADDGTLAYVSGGLSVAGNLTLVWTDLAGNATSIGMPLCACVDVSLSPDGTRVAMEDLAATEQSGSDLWIWSFDAETRTRLTFEEGFEDNAVWSPDSQRVFYQSSSQGLRSRAADGTGTVEQLRETASGGVFPYGLDTDGNVVFTIADRDIFVLNDSGGSSDELLLASEFNEARPALSPGGRWLAYESDENGQKEIYVRPYPDVDSGKWQISSGGGTLAKWAADGSRLYFHGPTHMMAAEVELEPAFRRQTPEQLFALAGFFTDNFDRTFDVSADGDRFLMIQEGAIGSEAADAQVIIVENWLTELERLVPAE